MERLKVLCVDDNMYMLKAVSAVLSGVYDVSILPDGTRLKEYLERETPDLFLLDYYMPVLNGFELIPIIREFPEHRNTPIVFLTAIYNIECVKQAISLGVIEYIVKPVSNENLLAKIARHIVRNPKNEITSEMD